MTFNCMIAAQTTDSYGDGDAHHAEHDGTMLLTVSVLSIVAKEFVEPKFPRVEGIGDNAI